MLSVQSFCYRPDQHDATTSTHANHPVEGPPGTPYTIYTPTESSGRVCTAATTIGCPLRPGIRGPIGVCTSPDATNATPDATTNAATCGCQCGRAANGSTASRILCTCSIHWRCHHRGFPRRRRRGPYRLWTQQNPDQATEAKTVGNHTGILSGRCTSVYSHGACTCTARQPVAVLSNSHTFFHNTFTRCIRPRYPTTAARAVVARWLRGGWRR
jgi:hypothetical protein